LRVKIKNSNISSLTQSACDTYTFFGKTLTTSGTYYDTLTNSSGCDSIIILYLSIYTLDTSISKNKTVLRSNEVNAYYQWATCNPFELIDNAKSIEYKASKSGDYAVIIYNNFCIDTSTCISIPEEAFYKPEFVVYPNPTKDLLYIESPSLWQNGEIRLMNMTGQTILHRKQLKGTKFSLNTAMLSKGIYTLRCQDDEQVYMVKIVKE
jgi:hypothetical protein